MKQCILSLILYASMCHLNSVDMTDMKMKCIDNTHMLPQALCINDFASPQCCRSEPSCVHIITEDCFPVQTAIDVSIGLSLLFCSTFKNVTLLAWIMELCEMSLK